MPNARVEHEIFTNIFGRVKDIPPYLNYARCYARSIL